MFKSKHTLKKLVCAVGVSTMLISLPAIVQAAWEPKNPSSLWLWQAKAAALIKLCA